MSFNTNCQELKELPYTATSQLNIAYCGELRNFFSAFSGVAEINRDTYLKIRGLSSDKIWEEVSKKNFSKNKIQTMITAFIKLLKYLEDEEFLKKMIKIRDEHILEKKYASKTSINRYMTTLKPSYLKCFGLNRDTFDEFKKLTCEEGRDKYLDYVKKYYCVNHCSNAKTLTRFFKDAQEDNSDEEQKKSEGKSEEEKTSLNDNIKFENCYKKIKPTLKKLFNTDDASILKDDEVVLKIIEYLRGLSKTTINGHANAFDVVCRHLKFLESGESFSDFWYENKMEMDENTIMGVKSKRQETNWVEWPELMKKTFDIVYDKVEEPTDEKKLKKLRQERLVYLFYLGLPPRRNSDYRLMKYITVNIQNPYKVGDWVKQNYSQDYNYLVYNKRRHNFMMIFNVYKTAPQYGTYISDLPEELFKFCYFDKDDFMNVLGWFDFDEDSFIFGDSGGEPISEPEFSQLVSGFFARRTGRTISIQLLRHIFISYVLDVYKPSAEEMRDIGDFMAHTIEMQRDYRKH